MKTETKTIDGREYQCTTMPATKALRIMARLVGIVGEPLFQLVSGGVEEADAGHMSSAARIMIGKLHEQDVAGLAKDMLSSVTCDGVDVGGRGFDLHFAGRIGHLMRVLLLVLETNYRDFFDALPLSAPGPASTTAE